MGVNIVALFPLFAFSAETLRTIEQVERSEFAAAAALATAMQAEGFATGSRPVQWYDKRKPTAEAALPGRPMLPDINMELLLPGPNLNLCFRADAFAIWSVMRARLVLGNRPESRARLLDVYREIGRGFGAAECWIMGDDNPIYHAFERNQDYSAVAGEEKFSLAELYPDPALEVEGFYRLPL
ncbi:hypothetical protein EJV47_17500 [Hymenobacter gummosus]|uniref:Uncharacterized protein n=1 Tax=Hymenobacter gummosus TaxID=1776032 RepID=A0A431U0L0_9BACT|nr:hypothetical protein [Hymenobacter gummosus]RTQ48223.1 hypothetical protein EJV47_17500 [Hymenobacter gummosus]